MATAKSRASRAVLTRVVGVLFPLLYGADLFAQSAGADSSAQTADAADGSDATPSGNLSYRIPIPVPAARGPTPALALTWSPGTSSVAGFGFSLAGLPAVIRVAADNGMMFNGSDTFAFAPDGLDVRPPPRNYLVPVTKAQANRYHRAYYGPDERFTEFQAVGSSGSGPCYWLMRDGHGTTYQFGNDSCTSAVKIEQDNGDTGGRGLVAWALYRITDADGNYLEVTYLTTGPDLVPQKIDYNLSTIQQPARAFRVEFDYDTCATTCSAHRTCNAQTTRCKRPDVTPLPNRTPYLLHYVYVYGLVDATSKTLISHYMLEHRPSSASGRSMLFRFWTYGSSFGSAPLDPITLSYSASGGGPTQLKASTNSFLTFASCDPDNPDHLGCRWNTFVGDIDGDGRADVVRTHYSDYGGKVQYTCAAADNSGLSQSVSPIRTIPTWRRTI